METSTVPNPTSNATNTNSSATNLMISNVDSQCNKSPSSSPSSAKSPPLSNTSLDTGQMRSSSPFTPNSFPLHKSSLMSSSSPPAAATAGSPLPNTDTRLSPSKEPPIIDDQQQLTASINDGNESVTSSLSDVETFNGKIVYNPDGSAYIIEGPDSDGSEVEAEISQEGSIIDARGHSPNYGSISFPQIVSAFHISRSSAAELYSSLYESNLSQNVDPEKTSDVPVMHSYRVFTLRNKKTSSDTNDPSNTEEDNENCLKSFDDEQDNESKLRSVDCPSVPVKPILMCFICKLSFGYTKSFVAHAIGEHHLALNEEEKRVLSTKNTSAIIQGVGKEKEPLLSFLQPKSSPAPFRTNQLTSQSQQQLDAQRLLAVQMAVASALRSNSLSSSSSGQASTLNNTNHSSDLVTSSINSPNQSNNPVSDNATQPPPTASSQSTDGDCELSQIKEEDSVDFPNNNNNNTNNEGSNFDKVSPDTASQFASELADLANLEKFAQAAAAAAQQQHMDLHSIAAVMAAVAASNNNNNKTNQQNRTPSPGSKVSSPKSGSQLINTSQLPNVSTAAAFTNNLIGNTDAKSISSLFNSPPPDGETSNLLATVANHVARPTLSAASTCHPPLLMQHSRNSCKTLKCPKCNWHYKYQETLEIHMKEKHPENEMNCIYCLTNQPHPRLARGETYTCGYKPYRCDVCNYSTTTKGNLSIHMQSDKHINNVQELQNGNIPATAEHLLQSQALAAAVAQASAAVAANGNGSTPPSTSNAPTNTTLPSSSSVSPTPTPTSVANMAVIAAAAQQQDSKTSQMQVKMSTTNSSNPTPQTPPSTPNSSSGSKQKATWRCDVCNYETNVARNLRIHMTSEKHTHNIMVLKQNVTQMQQLNAIQQGILSPEQLLQLNPGFFAAAAAAAAAGMGNSGQSGPSENTASMQPEVALADMAYNHALLMMASQQQQRTMAALMQQQQQQQQQQQSNESKSPIIVNGMQATFDIEHPDPCLTNIANSIPLDESSHLYNCCICGTFTTDSIDALSQHIQCDRTRTREDEVLMSVGGSYICKLCSYKTNLKANFQLHCKTDKHLQRLQHVNHIKEGGTQSEWKLKLVNMSNPVQVIRCNVCNYYTNSIHKLQLHSANPRHDVYSRIYNHLQLSELNIISGTTTSTAAANNNNNSNKYYYCTLCSAATPTKIQLIQHLNTFKHIRNENLRQLKQTTSNNNNNNNDNPISSGGIMKDSEEEIREMFLVKELRPGDKIIFENNDDELNANIVGSPTFDPSTDPLLLKNALMEQVKLGLQNENDSQQQLQSSSSNVAINCPFCSFSNTSEIRVQMHILTAHQQQQQPSQSSSSSTDQQNQQLNPIVNQVPPSILCPLCQEAFHEKLRLENHLVEVHNVTKEGVQRLMLLVDTSELDKFAATQQTNNNNKLNDDGRRDMSDFQNEDDDDGRRSECDSRDSNSKMCDEEMIDASNMMSNINANNSSILEHLICPICNRMYLNLEELYNHMVSESHMKTVMGGQFQCWRIGCGQTFKTILAVQQHFKDQHFSKCVKLTNSSANLASNAPVSDRHVYKYRCSQCSLAFKTFEKLQLHSQYHLIRAATQCVICGRSFRSVESLQKHVESSHSNLNEEELEQYKTNLMNNQLLFALGRNGGILDPATTELLKKESCRAENNEDDMMDTENGAAAIDLANSQSLKDGDENSQLIENMTDSFNADNGSNPVFNGNLSDNSSLEDYLNSQPLAEDNYNDPNRKFKCHRCKVAFTRQSYLTSHNKTLLHRKGEKMSYPMEKYLDPNRPFKCEICKESFTQKNILLVHYNSVSHLHRLKQSMKESSAAVAASVAAASTSNNVTATTTELEDSNNENKLFKCNLCKVSFSMASSLHNHLRSSLHQTRTSKLHELAQSGQLDLSLPLIEPLNSHDTNHSNSSSSKVNSAETSAKITNVPNATSCASPNSSKFPDMLASLNEQQQQALALQQAAINLALAGGNSNAQNNQMLQMNGQSPFTCVKCGAAFISQDAQMQHQQLCGLFGNITNVNLALAAQAKQQLSKLSNLQSPLLKNKPQLYKHLLETWGFEIVMQFNESNQKKKKLEQTKSEDDDSAETADKEEEQEQSEKLQQQQQQDEKPVEATVENENIPPEINKCQCDICFKEFSSIWVLKAHREEIHKDVVPLDVVESFADEYRSEYDKKFSNGKEEDATNEDSTPAENVNSSNGVDKSQPTATPSINNSSTPPPPPPPQVVPNPISNEINLPADQLANMNAALSPNGVNNLAQLLPNLSPNATPAEIAAANQMAAAHIQFSQLLMGMGLAGMAAGMPMPAGMNVPFAAAAAMGIPPQLIMMADPMMAAAAAFQNPGLNLAAAAAAAQLNQAQGPSNSTPGTPSPAPVATPVIPVQPPVNPAALNPQTAAVAAAATSVTQQQKRARTRISDEQLKVLRQYFDINNSPTEEQLIEMSQKSGLPMKVIKHWFRNTLFKERQRNKDSPYNFNNPPSTFLNLDEYEKTGEAKVITLDDLKKSENSTGSEETKEVKPKEKPNDSESECDGKNSSDLKSSSSNKDTDYATSDDEEMKRSNQNKESVCEPNESISNINNQLPKLQTCPIQQQQQAQQEFDQLSKSISFNINSPQPSESSMSSACESNNTSSLFAGLANFSPGLPTSQNMASSPLQLALDAAQRSQLAVAAAAVAANSSNMLSSTSPNVSTHSSSGKRANRTRFTDYQIKVLQEFFESNAYPKDDDLEYLSKLLNLSPRVIVVWFQNARQKARKVYENQPPTTPVGEDDGTGRFQRTPGLNYQCKKCLQVFQRYYELIKHQKSSCFKDENPLAAQIRMAAEARAQATSPSVSVSRDSASTPIDCTRSATATPEKIPINMLASPPSVASPSSLSGQSKTSPSNAENQTFRCDKCPMVFNRLDLWRDHQIVHIVNSNLFTATGNPFGLIQIDGGQTQPPIAQSPQPSPTALIAPGSKRKASIPQPSQEEDDDDESRDFDSMSGNGNSNSSDQTPRDKRLRTTILPEQLDYLYQKYQVDSNPSRKMLESIAKEVGLKKRVVQVWFQNTRARERKGQFRAHQQVIHKRCPFCRALFKARSALESHLATRHADQYTKGDINIDNLPDGDPSDDNEMPINEQGNTDSSQMADVMKRYEDSFKKYLDELNIQGKDGGQLSAEFAFRMMSALGQQQQQQSNTMHFANNSNNNDNNNHNNDITMMSSNDDDANSAHFQNSQFDDEQQQRIDDTRSLDDDFDSDAEEEIDYDYSPTNHINNKNGNNSKRIRTQITSAMVKMMKSIFSHYKTPTMAECQSLGKELGLPKRVVQVWFQNARAKEKKARSPFTKTQQESDNSNNPVNDQCVLCNIKYSAKLSMQEHLFSKIHLENLKNHIDIIQKENDGQNTQDKQDDDDFLLTSESPNLLMANSHCSGTGSSSSNSHMQNPPGGIFSAITNASNTTDHPRSTSDSIDPNKAAQFLQQLQMIQNLAIQNGQPPPFNLEELVNNVHLQMNNGQQQQQQQF